MKVVSYYNVVPSKNKSQEKFDILTKFVQGVNAIGDQGILHKGYGLLEADVGVIQGWQHEVGKDAPHLKLRQAVMDRTMNKHVCAVDANLFLYANKTNEPHHYLRYSFNGIFPNTGEYFDNNPDASRWNQISKDLNIRLEDYKTNGKHILICAQRNQGWSMGKINLDKWLIDTITQIRTYTDRQIIVRLHPKDNQTNRRADQIAQLLYNRFKSVGLSRNRESINLDLQNCWAVVNHNSSSIVGPIIKGYHAFVVDPLGSQCSSVTHHGFKDIESPKIFDRQSWLERISMFHWKFEELENGAAWRHIRTYV